MNGKRLAISAALALAALGAAFGQATPQTTPQAETLRRGIELFAQGRYAESVPLFDGLFLDAGAAELRAEGAYWSAMAQLALGDARAADRAIDLFLANFPAHPRVAELSYQRGRVAYLLEDYERAVQALNAYLAADPDGEYAGAALFWAAESLYALGRLPEADKLYRGMLERFPDHVKAEAARYRVALVQFKYREDELLTLLKWSHEESLRVVEEFQRRERAYEQALAVYQRRYGEVKTGTAQAQLSLEEELAGLKRSMDDLATQLRSKDERVRELEAQLAAAKAAAPDPAAQGGSAADGGELAARETLLLMKERGLNLVAFYLEALNAANGSQK